jgi:hypothetical protein
VLLWVLGEEHGIVCRLWFAFPLSFGAIVVSPGSMMGSIFLTWGQNRAVEGAEVCQQVRRALPLLIVA